MQRITPTVVLVSVLLVLSTPSAYAQATVELKVGSRQVFVGEAVDVSIEVSDYQSCEPPEVPDIPNATLRFSSTPSTREFTSIVNGRVTSSRTRSYQGELTPLAVGDLLLPAIAVAVDGRVLKTKEILLKVRPSNADQLFAIDVAVGRSRLYVGQRVPLTMTVWVKPAPYGNQVLSAEQMLAQIRPIEMGPFPRQISNDPRRARPRPDGKPDELFYAFDFVTEFVAQRPGRLAFDDVELGLAYPAAGGTRNLRARPTVPPIEVLPVPMEGRPASYNGAVGLFDIKTAADPTNVRVGDPIELTIDIFGDGPLETLPPPVLSADTRLAEAFRLPTEQLAGETQNARRRFRLTIRAKRDDITEIPPIEYPYFDPSAERFVIARSKPIPLTVAPAAEIALPDVTIRAPSAAGTPPTLQALDGLHDIETSEAALLATNSPVTAGLIASIMFAPPALFLLTWAGLVIVQHRASDPARVRRQAALRTAQRRIAQARLQALRTPGASAGSPTAALAHEITAALTGYLADRLGEPPGRFTGPAALEFLRARHVPGTLLETWSGLVQRCDEAAFAGGTAADGEALVTQALACLKTLERQKL